MRGFIDGEYQDGELRGLTFLVGLRGMGKTTLMANKLALCTGGVLFFDTLSKHAPVLPGYRLIAEPADLVEYLRFNRGRRFHILYQPRSGDLDWHFNQVCTAVKAFGWMILAIDEIDKLCGVRFNPSMMPPPLYELVNYGRHHRVSMIATARRPTSVAPGFRDEAEFWCFKLKADVADRLRGDLGDEAAKRIVRLDKYQYLRCTQEGELILCGGAQ